MRPIGRITVPSVIPERLGRLSDIAGNLWWTWNCEAVELFTAIDRELWDKTGANPLSFLKRVDSGRLEELTGDRQFLDAYDSVVSKFDEYMSNTDTWFNKTHPDMSGHMVAYFSAEYGLSETLPIYSGGLGVLSGDHCKSASDLGIPFTGIGLFYRQGYFNQQINCEGIQQTSFSTLNISEMPVHQVVDEKGDPILISVDFPGRTVYASIWHIKVGKVDLYLLDSDVPANIEHDRQITARLYGGDHDTRIQQEILLGIGGVRALDALGIQPAVYHMNEGHSAFLCFEVIRKFMKRYNISFHEAKELLSSSSVFTIHTPVPAGIDVFYHDAMDMYFTAYRESLGISRDEFLSFGREDGNPYGFNMAVVAMRMASGRNGVSKLHGAVTRRMFKHLWPGVPEQEVPVTHVTNGIHTLTWLSPCYRKLFDKYLPSGWESTIYERSTWEMIENIPDEELWKAHTSLKESMALYVNGRIRAGYMASNAVRPCRTLDPEALTIGFSRRFATYKRASLIFRDIQRIRKLLNKPDAPVQIIFAGKAHPADKPAQDIIKYINDISEQEGFEGKVVLLENYNMALARRLVQSVDVWLNNPRMPLEASGTSGMKAGLNGVLNFSVLDGWWREGYNGANGWAIGSETVYPNEICQDNADSESLYEVLERSLVPLYYDRDENGVPRGWVKMMKEAIISLAARFSTHRMLQDYTENLYVPAMKRACNISTTGNIDCQLVIQLAQWKKFIYDNWHNVSVRSDSCRTASRSGAGVKMGAPVTAGCDVHSVPGTEISLDAAVHLGSLKPEDVAVELYYGSIGQDGEIINGMHKVMQMTADNGAGNYRYTADIVLTNGGEYGYQFRVLPCHPLLTDKFELRLVKWAE
ncbi:MAG: glycosyltransferase family 1 protein [Clostridiaceae bacterium]|nr:glycosyltransferase family 1 protein [Clostridiaceae bacterium]